MIIGITGSSGAGKSTVCEILQNKYNAKVINADKISKQLSKKGTDYLKEIVEQFGQEILLESGELNRQKLAEIIYANPKEREKLNNCTFRYIREEIKLQIKKLELKWKEYKKSEDESEPIIVIDAPLLFEAELESICQFVISVISNDRKLQIQRLIQRDGITKEQAIARLEAQKTNEFYVSRSKYVIINNGSFRQVEEQIDKIFQNKQ